MNLNNFLINKKDPIYKQTVKLKTYINGKVKEKILGYLFDTSQNYLKYQKI